MIDLERKIFGNIRAREIIGEIPPAEPDTREKLLAELEKLTNELTNKSREELESLLNYQNQVQRQVNSRPGAMALPQDKIEMFVAFNEKYMNLLRRAIKPSLQGAKN